MTKRKEPSANALSVARVLSDGRWHTLYDLTEGVIDHRHARHEAAVYVSSGLAKKRWVFVHPEWKSTRGGLRAFRRMDHEGRGSDDA